VSEDYDGHGGGGDGDAYERNDLLILLYLNRLLIHYQNPFFRDGGDDDVYYGDDCDDFLKFHRDHQVFLSYDFHSLDCDVDD
jgi:hypothetical protein